MAISDQAPRIEERAHVSVMSRIILSQYSILGLTVVYFVVCWLFFPRILSIRNIDNIFSNVWPLLAVAIGQMFVLIVAGIDLSQTSIMALTSVIGSLLITNKLDPNLFAKSPFWGWLISASGGPLAHQPGAVLIAVLVMLIVGTIVGILNGVSVALFRMPPFMVTLVSMILFSALAIFLPKSQNIMNLPQSFNDLGEGRLWIIPIPLIIGILLIGLVYIILQRTLVGRWLYGIGHNPKAARISGVPVRSVIVFAYAMSGFCAAIAAIMYSGQLEMGRPTLGATLLLDIVGANIIGGVSLFGGRGRVGWAFIGVFFFIILANTLNFMNLSVYLIDVIKGAIILGATFLDVARRRLAAHQMA
ncbi:MAG TPA: ABC transporter permease [Spirochaetia bacterium]|nr:ABC transporter permease [Spirochaetia bacterium]